jgi:uncharacterized protein YkwD
MNLGGNWVDLVIIAFLLYFFAEALRHGFWVILADFASFLGSLLLSLRVYQLLARFLRSSFSLSHSVSNALGFLISAILLEAILGFLLGHLIVRIPKKLWRSTWLKIAGPVLGVGEGLILVAFILTLIIGLPLKVSLKADVSASKIGGYILKQTSGAERLLNDIFGGVIEDSLTYLTVKPGSRERIDITAESIELKEDQVAETEMFRLINEERRKGGVGELSWAPEIALIARGHARDMWERRYFGHVSPEGKDVGDRLDTALINYTFAGENLALAPTVTTAHNGLMSSEGHRTNILEKRFNKIGVGVIDNGIYGKMFVQVFTD